MAELLNDLQAARTILGGMSRSTIYEKIKSGELHPIRVGSRIYFTGQELERFVRSLEGNVEPTATGHAK